VENLACEQRDKYVDVSLKI